MDLKVLECFDFPGSRGLQLWSISINFCLSRCSFDRRCKSGRGFSKPACLIELLGVVCTRAAEVLWAIFCGAFFFKGIQAQTVANFYLAFEAQLAIIPVINKVKKTHYWSFTVIHSEIVMSLIDWPEKCWSRKSGVTDWKGLWYSTWGVHSSELKLLFAVFFTPCITSFWLHIEALTCSRYQPNLEPMWRRF